MMKASLFLRLVLVGLLGFMASSSAYAAEAVRQPFGQLSDGTQIESVVLQNRGGVVVRIMTLGASIQSLRTPDRNGRVDDIVLGYDTAAEYLGNPQYFGSTVGRFANRIAKGHFALDGTTYQLVKNDGPNHLHGGNRGFDKRIWSIIATESGTDAVVVMRLVSPDGDEGYPGRLTATVTYALNDKNELKVTYEATATKATIVNLTNHSYFNLAGQTSSRSILDQRLTIFGSHYTPVDQTLIPTGTVSPVAGTAFDFRQPHAIGERIHFADEQLRFGRGYDHNWVLDGAQAVLKLAARLEDPQSGRVLEISSTAPAIQFYSGNFLDGRVVGRAGRSYRQSDGLCLEPQTFPDGPNHSNFPSARLDPGQTYRSTIVYRFSIAMPTH
jgi:aldose 1-epimerase